MVFNNCKLFSVVTVQPSAQRVKSQRIPLKSVKILTGVRHCLNYLVVVWALSVASALEGRIVWAYRKNRRLK